MQTIRVRAVKGALVPHPTKARTYVGYRPAKPDETPDHRFGRSSAGLVIDGAEEVLLTTAIAGAIRRRDLEVVTEAAPSKRAPKTEA